MIKATLGDYVAACGNSLPAGALLKHMEYLCAHSNIVVDEHKWYIKPRDNMRSETGLTVYSYKLAMQYLQETGFIQVDYTTSLLPNQKSNVRRTMFSVTPLAAEAVEKAVSMRKGTYVSKPQCGPESTDTVVSTQPTVGVVIGNPSLYKGEEILEETLNITPNASASVQTQVSEIEKCFRKETNYHCSWDRSSYRQNCDHLKTFQMTTSLQLLSRRSSKW